MALVGSEIGEAANECRGAELTDNFIIEMSDIVLRILALAEQHNINSDNTIKTVLNKEEIQKSLDGLSVLDSLSIVFIQFGKATEQYVINGNSKLFWDLIFKVVTYVTYITNSAGYDIENFMKIKIKENLKKGSKGRLI